MCATHTDGISRQRPGHHPRERRAALPGCHRERRQPRHHGAGRRQHQRQRQQQRPAVPERRERRHGDADPNGAGSYVRLRQRTRRRPMRTLKNNGGRRDLSRKAARAAMRRSTTTAARSICGNTADLSGATIDNASGQVYVNGVSAPTAAIGSLSGAGNVVLGQRNAARSARSATTTPSAARSRTRARARRTTTASLYIDAVMLGNGARGQGRRRHARP